MKIIDVASGEQIECEIVPLEKEDVKNIPASRYFFNWKKEADDGSLFKLRILGEMDIKGVMKLIDVPEEERIEIKLLAVSKENMVLKKDKGKKQKKYKDIAGNMISFAASEALKTYGVNACVSLLPKTELRNHYISKYSMLLAGSHVFLEGGSLLNVINQYPL